MREVAFLKKNEQKWKDLEAALGRHGKLTPDELSDRYIQLTDDYAYAKTFYPNSQTAQYLNQLLTETHARIYRNKKESKNRLINYWKVELPQVIFRRRKYLLYSLIIFSLSALIGVYSSYVDDEYVRLILGESYVNMTIENMEKGEPMAIYESRDQLSMFLGITFNNIRVSFNAFASGIFFAVGTALILLFNGIMLGSFQFFFYEHNYLLESVLSIWVHGVLEISAIVIAGGAGLMLGSSFMFPDTFSRLESFKRGARDGVKIIFGLIPIFIVAGFLEGFVTRHADILPWLSVIIISSSLLFIGFYFIYYPFYINKKYTNGTN